MAYFRDTFATRLLAQGTDIATVKKLLGHPETKTTMRYAHTSKAAKVKAAAKPSDKLVAVPRQAEQIGPAMLKVVKMR